MKTNRTNWFVSLIIIYPILLYSQNQLSITRINGEVTLDGLSNETAWQGIEPLPVVEHTPNFGNEPSEKTEILIAYDNKYLYLAGRLFDSEPEKIQANSKQRDSEDGSSDWFGIVIDSFNDSENALAFFTSPEGLRWDAAVINDADGGDPLQTSWNTFWDVNVTRNDKGWFAEFRIPFTSLRFQDVNGRISMGIIVWRSIARKNEWIIFPEISPDWGFHSLFKPSKAQKVLLEDVYESTPVYLTPYVLAGSGYLSELNESETAYKQENKTKHETGLDVKYGLSNNLTLDLTVNTDFAQVEADDEQINLTRFPLFFPEKRLFFQERASIFDFSFESSDANRLFYSRRIGLCKNKPVRIYGGARVVGRIGFWDMGFLNMQTKAIDSLPSENFGVLRLRRQVFNPFSYVGAIATTRIGMNGTYNIAYGLDGVFRLFGDDYLTLKWAQTFDDEHSNDRAFVEASRIRLLWERRTQNGLGYGINYSRAGSDYNPGIGFEQRKNFSRFANGTWYGWFFDEQSAFFYSQLYLSWILVLENYTNIVESVTIDQGWLVSTKSGYEFHISPVFTYENIPETFLVAGNTKVPSGNYKFYELGFKVVTPGGNPLCISSVINGGKFYDGSRITFNFDPTWRISSSVELQGSYEFNHINFPDRNQKVNVHIARLHALYMLSTEFSVSAFIQFNSDTESVVNNIRLRYNPAEGVDFYVVYNEGLNTNRFREYPIIPLSNDRTLLLKFNYTFNL